MFEEEPTGRNPPKKTSKNKIPLGAEKITGSKPRQENPKQSSEAATRSSQTPRTKKTKKPSTISNPVKMTSPTQEKVKTASTIKKKKKCESPGLSRMMKPRNKADVANMLKLVKPDEQNSPLKTSKIISLIKGWESSSIKMLTPALPITASLRTEMDSQLDRSL